MAAVFVGTVTEIEAEPDDPHFGRIVHFSVQESFRGPERAETVVFTMTELMCGVEFQLHQQYLVFAYGDDDGKLRVRICGGTRLLTDAKQELEEVRRISKSKEGGRLYGEVFSQEGMRWTRRPLGGVRVSVEGPVSKSVTTNAQGEFEIRDLVPGKYRVRAEITDAATGEKPVEEVELFRGGCVAVNLRVKPKTTKKRPRTTSARD